MATNVTLVTSSYDHNIKFWDALRGESVKMIELPHEKQIANRLEISFDRSLLAAACTSSLRIFDIAKEQPSLSYNFDSFESNVTGAGFQRDCKWAFAASEEGSIKIFDLREAGFQRSQICKDSPINAIVLHPNEAELYLGDQNGNIRIYDLQADKMRPKIPIMPDIGIRSISMAPNASFMCAGDSAGYLHVWNLKNGEVNGKFSLF
eukprot:TRINITY_DN2286_c0_g3_i2.p1 TRINITY_DN2286_c0_g3~~TRINITY_DN2286_c0_g3_i2.p1  ORF type:complete len:206 (-),score=31.22 TRINITY_DN2286_c0_g3_i2:886-1503(-)